jgi:hypothetical protein
VVGYLQVETMARMHTSLARDYIAQGTSWMTNEPNGYYNRFPERWQQLLLQA